MKLTIEIDGATELGPEAINRLVALLTSGVSVASVVSTEATPAPRKRQPKQDAAAFTRAAAVEAGMLPVTSAMLSVGEPSSQLDIEDAVAAASPETPVEPKLDTPAALSVEELLQKLRGVLGKFGAVWFRQNVGEVYKVDKLTDMSQAQLAEVWAKVQE